MNTQPISIDPHIQSILESSMDKLESESGNKYNLTVHQYGKYIQSDLVLRPFDQRNTYMVYDMKDEYKALEGKYDSYQQVKDRLRDLCLEYTEDHKLDSERNIMIWKCPKCHEWGSSEQKNYYHDNSGINLCQNCQEIYSSIWNDVKIDLNRGTIDESGGGSISICHNLGRIKFT